MIAGIKNNREAIKHDLEKAIYRFFKSAPEQPSSVSIKMKSDETPKKTTIYITIKD